MSMCDFFEDECVHPEDFGDWMGQQCADEEDDEEEQKQAKRARGSIMRDIPASCVGQSYTGVVVGLHLTAKFGMIRFACPSAVPSVIFFDTSQFQSTLFSPLKDQEVSFTCSYNCHHKLVAVCVYLTAPAQQLALEKNIALNQALVALTPLPTEQRVLILSCYGVDYETLYAEGGWSGIRSNKQATDDPSISLKTLFTKRGVPCECLSVDCLAPQEIIDLLLSHTFTHVIAAGFTLDNEDSGRELTDDEDEFLAVAASYLTPDRVLAFNRHDEQVDSSGFRSSLLCEAVRPVMQAWVNSGGKLLLHFESDGATIHLDILRDWFGLSWVGMKYGDNSTYTLQADTCTHGPSTHWTSLPLSRRSKAYEITGVVPGDRLYAATLDGFGKPRSDEACSVAVSSFGAGKVAYFGDRSWGDFDPLGMQQIVQTIADA
jgi:hypothetical protein